MNMIREYGCSDDLLMHYDCFRVGNGGGNVNGKTFPIDGDLEKFPWNIAPFSRPFVDMVTGAPAFLETRCALVWDQECLYVAFRIKEPDIRAEMTERDSRIYLENDVEVFIGGEDCYYEFQVNALGTIYEVFYIWQEAYKKGSRFDIPEFDFFAHKIDVIGGFQDGSRYEKHPRGKRWAFMDWDFPGLRWAVKVDGTINDSSDIDNEWSAEMAFPWKGMKLLLPNAQLPPKEDFTLRMDLSRFEKLEYNGAKPDVHPGWSLNPHGIYDSHIPECFSYIHLKNEILK